MDNIALLDKMVAEEKNDDSELYTIDGRGLKYKLLEIVDAQEECIKAIVHCLFAPGLERVQRNEQFNENFDKTMANMKKLNSMLEFVKPHQEREVYLRRLSDVVMDKNAVINKLSSELRAIELSLTDAAFQAQKKLKSIQTAHERKVNTDDVVRLSHLISRSYSVAAPFTWVQGDPSRPFPTEMDFSVSSLMKARTNPAESNNVPTALAMIRGAGDQSSAPTPRPANSSAVSTPMGNTVRASPLAQLQQQSNQQAWTPSPRSGVYGPPQSSPGGRGGGQTSSGRGRPRGSTSSPRAGGPSILQRRGSSSATNSPRLTSPMSRGAKSGGRGAKAAAAIAQKATDVPAISSESSSDTNSANEDN